MELRLGGGGGGGCLTFLSLSLSQRSREADLSTLHHPSLSEQGVLTTAASMKRGGGYEERAPRVCFDSTGEAEGWGCVFAVTGPAHSYFWHWVGGWRVVKAEDAEESGGLGWGGDERHSF